MFNFKEAVATSHPVTIEDLDLYCPQLSVRELLDEFDAPPVFDGEVDGRAPAWARRKPRHRRSS
jgi:hypothetical protein